jgi:hypothetical protein
MMFQHECVRLLKSGLPTLRALGLECEGKKKIEKSSHAIITSILSKHSCLVASRTVSRSLTSSHATSLLTSSLSHHLPRPQPKSLTLISVWIGR